MQIFSESIRNGEVPKKEVKPYPKEEAVSAYRKKYYRKYTVSWYRLMETMRAIEDGYESARNTSSDSKTLNKIFLDISRLHLSLRRSAGIEKIIAVTRHGDTETDMRPDTPGSDDESLTDKGKSDSVRKREILK